MKKKIITALILSIGFIGLSGCEKDDICSAQEPTTPSLVVEFYEYLDQDIPNNGIVRAYAVSEPDHLIQSIGNKIILPFRLDQQTTSWVLESLTQNGQELSVKSDTLTFSYRIETFFLNKACGYVSNFYLNQDGSSPLLNGKANQSEGNWIQQYQTQTNEITSEEQAHLKIFY